MLLKRILFFGFRHYCPICQSSLRRLYPLGDPQRPNYQCPICYSLGRHRLAWLFFRDDTNLLDDSHKRMLHVAPERSLAERFKKIRGIDYVSADISSPHAMMQMDVTAIPWQDNYIDIIYCSHVLEHIPADRTAMREFRRILKENGYAVVQVPITADKTLENPSVTDQAGRERLFGQSDHVRRYGPDFKERLEETGFEVKVYVAGKVWNSQTLQKMGIRENETLFCCTKKLIG